MSCRVRSVMILRVQTFAVINLGCRVNHYESEQLATLCRAAGLTAAPADRADLRIVHTCSVTVQAASKSRQTVRRAVRLPVLESRLVPEPVVNRAEDGPAPPVSTGELFSLNLKREPSAQTSARPRVVVSGCWA